MIKCPPLREHPYAVWACALEPPCFAADPFGESKTRAKEVGGGELRCPKEWSQH